MIIIITGSISYLIRLHSSFVYACVCVCMYTSLVCVCVCVRVRVHACAYVRILARVHCMCILKENYLASACVGGWE